GVSTKTLQRWDASGKLKAKRRPSGHRYYDESDVRKIFGGMNFKRKRFLTSLDGIMRGEVAKVAVVHKDRLVRFGFECFAHIAEENRCEIEVLNRESLSPQQEMAEDSMTIVHAFSCRWYGLRKYKKVLKEDFPATETVRSETAE
ncbi:MAG: MerR family transcriptional regulator, partial [Desulfobacteraceae bacterium]|nr:MerR family transcriptional regulator [Desulfobacteraceae bacterium]